MITATMGKAVTTAASMTEVASMIGYDLADKRIRNSAPYLAQPSNGALNADARAHLSLLRARLAIFLYHQPLDNYEQIMDVIDNSESTGEIKLLLDYVLAQCIARRAARLTGAAAPH